MINNNYQVYAKFKEKSKKRPMKNILKGKPHEEEKTLICGETNYTVCLQKYTTQIIQK